METINLNFTKKKKKNWQITSHDQEMLFASFKKQNKKQYMTLILRCTLEKKYTNIFQITWNTHLVAWIGGNYTV